MTPQQGGLERCGDGLAELSARFHARGLAVRDLGQPPQAGLQVGVQVSAQIADPEQQAQYHVQAHRYRLQDLIRQNDAGPGAVWLEPV